MRPCHTSSPLLRMPRCTCEWFSFFFSDHVPMSLLNSPLFKTFFISSAASGQRGKGRRLRCRSFPSPSEGSATIRFIEFPRPVPLLRICNIRWHPSWDIERPSSSFAFSHFLNSSIVSWSSSWLTSEAELFELTEGGLDSSTRHSPLLLLGSFGRIFLLVPLPPKRAPAFLLPLDLLRLGPPCWAVFQSHGAFFSFSSAFFLQLLLPLFPHNGALRGYDPHGLVETGPPCPLWAAALACLGWRHGSAHRPWAPAASFLFARLPLGHGLSQLLLPQLGLPCHLLFRHGWEGSHLWRYQLLVPSCLPILILHRRLEGL